MGWSSEFIQMISSERVTPIYVVEAVALTGSIRGTWQISTHASYGAAIISHEGVQGSSGIELTLRTWRTRFGSWSVMLVGDIGSFLRTVAKGQIVRMLIGFPGWPIEKFEPVALGQVWNIIRAGDGYRLDVRSIQSALRTRLTTTDNENALYDDILDSAATNVATTNYTVGLGTLSVSSAAAIKRQDDGSGTLKGVVGVTDNSGDLFFLSFTGISGNDLTTTVGDLYGTDDAAADIGNTVFTRAYWDDHPLDMIRRVLLSTGTQGGDWKWGLETWGYGLGDALIDHTETDKWRQRSQPASGSDDWEFVATEQTNGFEWLESVIAPGGHFITIRQGRIIGACVLDPYRQSVTTALTITDADIDQVVTHEFWDTRLTLEYNRVIVDGENEASSGVTTTGEASAMPAESFTKVILPHVWSNVTAIETEIGNRVAPWHLRIPERLVLVLRGWRMAQLSIGDILTVTSRRLRGRLPGTRSGYVGQRVMVTGVSTAWFGATVRVSLATLPDFDGPFDS